MEGHGFSRANSEENQTTRRCGATTTKPARSPSITTLPKQNPPEWATRPGRRIMADRKDYSEISRSLIRKVLCKTALELPMAVREQPMNGEPNRTMIYKSISLEPTQVQKVLQFRNHYECPNDGTKWSDEWTCRCNDRCPTCDAEIEPHSSDDLMGLVTA